MSGLSVTYTRVSGHGSKFKDWGSNLGERGAFPTVDGRVREVDIRLPGKANSNTHDARPIY